MDIQIVEAEKYGKKCHRLIIEGKDIGVTFRNEQAAKRRLMRMLDPNRNPVQPVKASGNAEAV